MSSLIQILRVKSYRSALDSLLQLDDAAFEAIVAKVLDGYPEIIDELMNTPSSSDDDVLTRAFLVAFETATREGHDAVAGDLRRALHEADQSRVDRLLAALHPDEKLRDRALGLGARDSALPILEKTHMNLDLRLVSDAGSPKLAPLATVRLTFDEPVTSANGAVVFQMSPKAVRELRSTIDDYLHQLDLLTSSFANAEVPDWALNDD